MKHRFFALLLFFSTFAHLFQTASVVQWIECQIPVLKIGVRVSSEAHSPQIPCSTDTYRGFAVFTLFSYPRHRGAP
jgi:hypothetical protein